MAVTHEDSPLVTSLCRVPQGKLQPWGRTRGALPEICPRVQKEDVRSGRRGGQSRCRLWSACCGRCFILTATRQYSHFTDENPEAPRGRVTGPQPWG